MQLLLGSPKFEILAEAIVSCKIQGLYRMADVLGEERQCLAKGAGMVITTTATTVTAMVTGEKNAKKESIKKQ